MEGTQHDCYPDTTVLINKLGITKQSELSFAEQRIVTGIYTLLEKETSFENVNFDFYKSLHRQLFCDLYEWAGTLRTINISKKGTAFCKVDELERLGELKFQKLAERGFRRTY